MRLLYDKGFDIGGAFPLENWFDASLTSAGYTFPFDQAWSGYWRANYSASPWAGEASAGASAGRNLSDTTWAPVAGTAVNGFTPAQFFNSSGHPLRLTTAEYLIDLLGDGTTSTGWTVSTCVKIDAYGGNKTTVPFYDQPLIWGSSAGNLTLCVTDTGIRLVAQDNAGVPTTAIDIAVSTGVYLKIQAQWTGTILRLRVDGGAWSSTSLTSYHSADFTGAKLQVGANYANTPGGAAHFPAGALTGEMLEISPIASVLSDTVLNDLNSYYTTRYALGGASPQTVDARGSLFALPLRGAGVVSLPVLSLVARGQTVPILDGVSPLALGGLTIPARGSAAPKQRGTSSLTIAALVVDSKGASAPPVRDTSTLTTGGLTVPSRGLERPTAVGTAPLTVTLSLPSRGIGSPSLRGTSSLTLGGLTVPSRGIASPAVKDSSALALGALSLVSRGQDAPILDGVSTLTAGAVTLVARGAPTVDRPGTASLSLGALALTSRGMAVLQRFGAAPAASSALALVSRGGASPGLAGTGFLALAPISLTARGLAPAVGFGASTITNAIFINTMGLTSAPQLRGAASVSLPVLTLAAKGLAAPKNAGASALTASALISSFGLRASSRVGTAPLAIVPISIASRGSAAPRAIGASPALAVPLALVARGASSPPVRGHGAAAFIGAVVVDSIGQRNPQLRGVGLLSVQVTGFFYVDVPAEVRPLLLDIAPGVRGLAIDAAADVRVLNLDLDPRAGRRG